MARALPVRGDRRDGREARHRSDRDGTRGLTGFPGPRIPVYLVGARMLEIFPVAPLALGGALSVALFSYAGGLCFGFNSDWDKFPDLPDLVVATEQEFEKLRKAVVAEPGALPTWDGYGDSAH